jgi:hypothetical protein
MKIKTRSRGNKELRRVQSVCATVDNTPNTGYLYSAKNMLFCEAKSMSAHNTVGVDADTYSSLHIKSIEIDREF